MKNIDTQEDAIVNDTLDEVGTETEAPAAVVEDQVEDKAPASAHEAAEQAAKALGLIKDAPVEVKPSAKTLMPKTADTQAPSQKKIDPITGNEIVPIKAPASWTPALREKWGNVDPTVQKYIADRERDLNQTLTKSAEDRKFAAEVKDILSPHDDLFSQYNVKGTDHIKELLSVSRILNTGTPQQKAQQLHAMIMHFQPDPQTLQALFAGQRVDVPPMQAPTKPLDLDAEVDKRLQERELKSAEQEAGDAFEAFANDPANEWAHDLRGMMGKAIESGMVQGKTVQELIKNSYDLAVRSHPEIQQIITSRTPASPAVQPRVKAVQSVKPGLADRRATPPQRAQKALTAREAALEAAREMGLE